MPQHADHFILTLGVSILTTLLSPQALFLITFSIFGMSIYQKSYSRFCVKINTTMPPCSGDAGSHFNSACNYSVWGRLKDEEVPFVVGSEVALQSDLNF